MESFCSVVTGFMSLGGLAVAFASYMSTHLADDTEAARKIARFLVPIALFIGLTGWLTGPWVGLGLYKINRANWNMVNDRDPQKVVEPAKPILLQAPTKPIILEAPTK